MYIESIGTHANFQVMKVMLEFLVIVPVILF
jgi:hypothetical protein